jgi:ABC-type Fe3+/spermidine/putrescine transport system ATPase subunit
VKRYDATTALAGISLSVAAGEFVSLLGPSGCGKTTLLRLVAGFVEPDGGDVVIAGRPMSGVPTAERNLGLVFQNYSLWPHMSVADNVAFGLDCRGVRGAERRSRVAECLELVRLGELAGRIPRELSGGQQQRVALARALAYRPTVLLLDEPLSALDRKLRQDLQQELRRLQREVGITTILVTHDQDEALALSNRIAVMNAGRIEQVATPEVVYAQPASEFVASFVGRANLIAGSVKIDSQGHSHFVADLGPSRSLGPGFFASQRLRAVVRPECIRLCEPDAPGALPAVVVDWTFTGASTAISVEVETGDLLVLSAPRVAAVAPEKAYGQIVGVIVDIADATLIV